MELEKRLCIRSAINETIKILDSTDLLRELPIFLIKSKKIINPTAPVVVRTKSKLESDPEQECEEKS